MFANQNIFICLDIEVSSLFQSSGGLLAILTFNDVLQSVANLLYPLAQSEFFKPYPPCQFLFEKSLTINYVSSVLINLSTNKIAEGGW